LNARTCAYPGYPERIELICAKGTAVLTGDSLQAHLLDGRKVTAGANLSSGVGSDPMAFGHELHRALLADFIGAVKGENPLVVTGDDALRSQSLITDILEANQREA
jgi:predicted dehydrogenase